MKPETQKQIDDLLLWTDKEAKRIMEEVAKESGISINALADLVAWEREQQEYQRSRNMTLVFNEVFENEDYWGK